MIYSRDDGITKDYLNNNPQKIIEQSQQIKMNWQEIAKMAEVSRDRIYHWFNETFLRTYMRKITGAEKALIKQEIMKAIRSGEIAKPTYQAELKEKLFSGEPVHRSEFSIVFNNCVRSKDVKKAIEQAHVVLPNKREKQARRK